MIENNENILSEIEKSIEINCRKEIANHLIKKGAILKDGIIFYNVLTGLPERPDGISNFGNYARGDFKGKPCVLHNSKGFVGFNACWEFSIVL